LFIVYSLTTQRISCNTDCGIYYIRNIERVTGIVLRFFDVWRGITIEGETVLFVPVHLYNEEIKKGRAIRPRLAIPIHREKLISFSSANCG
jgi:hypothetical protein